MTDLISRAALLAHFRKQRDEFFEKHATQEGQPSRKFTVDFDDELDQLDQRIALIESFPAVEPVATLVNNNQVGTLNIIETAPNVTIDIGTKLYMSPRDQIVGHLGAALMQALPSDDQIIMGHVQDAYDLAVALPR
jgi:hypothetical protein